jgi:predicted metal-dependent phosphoesterase TrpH
MVNENTQHYIMDTHMHSLASDGAYRPSDVVANAKKAGLEVIALTDHDTVFGVDEAMKAGRDLGVVVIPGIEIDAVYNSPLGNVQNIELLGLGVDLPKISGLSEKRSKDRIGMLEEYVNNFNNYIASPSFQAENETKQFKLLSPNAISIQDIITWYNSKMVDSKGQVYENPTPFLSKMSFINYVAKMFLSKENSEALKKDRAVGDAFKKEYKAMLKGSKETKPSFYEAIAAAKAAGGLAIVAHPGLDNGYKDGMIKEWELPQQEWFNANKGVLTPYVFISDLKAHGLDGLEIYNYSEGDPAKIDIQVKKNTYFQSLADKLGLVVSYGSDCHGKKGKEMLGKFGSEHIYLQDIVARYK